MLIIREKETSPDYYDFLMNLGVDKKVVFERKPSQKSFAELPRGSFLFCPETGDLVVSQCHIVGHLGVSSICVYKEIDREFHLIAQYMGRSISVAEILKEHEFIHRFRWYGVPDHFVDVLNFDGKDVSDICRRYGIITASQKMDNVDDINIPAYVSYLINTTRGWPYRQQIFGLNAWKINHGDLKNTRVVDRLDPERAFQLIYDAVLANKQTDMVEVSDKTKLDKAGFDRVQSFRHRKEQ